MFSKQLSLALLLLCASGSSALTIDLPPGQIKRLVVTAKADSPEWAIGWRSDTGFLNLKIKRHSDATDDIRGKEYTLTLTDSANHKLGSERLCLNDFSPLSIRLAYTRDHGLEIIGSGQKEFFKSITVPGPKINSSIEIFPGKKGRLTYHNVNIETLRPLEFYDEANEYPADSHSGIWHQLDLVTPKNGGVLVGGNYQLKLVPDPACPTGYVIVYLNGADIEHNYWKPGAVKGRLTPTDFDNHYNVEWIGSNGEPVVDDTSATFQGDNLLVIEFPQLESSIRFSRSFSE